MLRRYVRTYKYLGTSRRLRYEFWKSPFRIITVAFFPPFSSLMGLRSRRLLFPRSRLIMTVYVLRLIAALVITTRFIIEF